MDKDSLKNILKNSNITYQELSEKSGVPIDTIKKFMSGSTHKLRKFNEEAIKNSITTIKSEQIVQNYISSDEEEVLTIYRKLSNANKEVILKNLYILLDPDDRKNFNVLRNIK